MATNTTPRTALESASVRIDRRKLRRARQLMGLNQLELAEASGLKGPYISHLETGRRRTLSPGAYARICDALAIQDRTELLAPEVPEEGEPAAAHTAAGGTPSEGAAQ